RCVFFPACRYGNCSPQDPMGKVAAGGVTRQLPPSEPAPSSIPQSRILPRQRQANWRSPFLHSAWCSTGPCSVHGEWSRRAGMGRLDHGRGEKDRWQHSWTLGVFLLVLSIGVSALSATPAGAEPDLRQELQTLKVQLEHDRLQMEQDRQRIEQLERQVGSVAAQSEQKSKELEEKITKQALDQPTFGQYLDRFAGEHRLSITGYGFATYDWQQRANTNTFGAGFEPI